MRLVIRDGDHCVIQRASSSRDSFARFVESFYIDGIKGIQGIVDIEGVHGNANGRFGRCGRLISAAAACRLRQNCWLCQSGSNGAH